MCVYSTIVCRILFMSATLLDVCVLLSFAPLYKYRLNYFSVTIGKYLICRHTYVMFRVLEMMTLDLMCLYSNTVPKYLE